MAADRELVRWYWPHLWALDQTLKGLRDATVTISPVVPTNLANRQLALVRRYKAATWMAGR